MTRRYMKKTNLILKSSVIVLGLALLSACQPQSNDVVVDPYNQTSETSEQSSLPNTGEPSMRQLDDFEQITANQATISTTKGDIVVELYQQQTPITVANFLNLAQSGFYDGIKVHRVEPGFVIQAGDPNTKEAGKEAMWGTGGPGYTIPDEFDDELSHDSAGILSMANAGPNTGGSQFFITLSPTTFLDGKHTVFGKVTEGMDVVNSIEVGDTITGISFE